MAKKPSLEDEQRAFSEATQEPESEAARKAIRQALGSKRSLVAARAANLIRRHRLEGFDAELAAAFARFLVDGAKSDPRCAAKLAIAEALDYGESMDEAPFLLAARCVQLEPVWGGLEDTAAGVRARGVVALARIGWTDLPLVAAELLADEASPARQSALEALAHRGERSNAGLVLYKLKLGDEDPLVTLAAMSALLALAPERGLAELRAIVDGDDADRRELACVALGQARGDDALALLTDALERSVRPEERAAVLRGLGLHRSERALDVLAQVIAERGVADARAAIAALGARRFEPQVVARARKAVAANPRAHELAAALDETFTKE
jgi:hypothetical protein